MAFLPTLYKTKTQEIWQRQKKKNNNNRKARECKIRSIEREKLENATSDQFKQKLRGEYRIKHRKAKRATEDEKKWMEKRVADAEKATENEIKELHIITMVGVEKKSVWQSVR